MLVRQFNNNKRDTKMNNQKVTIKDHVCVKDFESHVYKDLKDHAMMEARIIVLEKGQDSIDKIQEKVMGLEGRFSNVSDKLDSLSNRVNDFSHELRTEFNNFTDKISNNNSSFIRWLIGTVLLSLMLGLFAQYKAFREIHEKINTIQLNNITKQDSTKVK